MIIGNLGITPRDNCVEIQIGAATPSRTVLFTANEVEALCVMLRQAADKARSKADTDNDILGDLL